MLFVPRELYLILEIAHFPVNDRTEKTVLFEVLKNALVVSLLLTDNRSEHHYPAILHAGHNVIDHLIDRLP